MPNCKPKTSRPTREHVEFVLTGEPPTPEAIRAGEQFDSWFREALAEKARELQASMVQSALP